MTIPPILFREQADYRQIVAENANSTLRGGTSPRQRCSIADTFANRREDVELNRRAQCGRPLKGHQSVENDSRIGSVFGLCGCHFLVLRRLAKVSAMLHRWRGDVPPRSVEFAFSATI